MVMQGAPLDEKSTAFLTEALGSLNIAALQLAGDASSRRYYRVLVGDHSYVLMVWEPFHDDGRYPFLNVLQHFEKHNVQVPKVIAKSPALGLVLLEDLGDLTLERKFWENQNQSIVQPFYEQAMDELIKIHYPASRDRSAHPQAGECVAFTVAFNTEKLLWEMNYGREHLIEKLCRVKLSPKESMELDRIFLDICENLDREEKLICHRDYHSRNLMIKQGKIRVIDFQDARMGPIQYDLVSLVHDSYVEMNDSVRGQILDYYIRRANEFRERAINRENFDKIFRLQMVQRCFKACGSFASFYNMREDRRYLKYLEPTLKKVSQTLEYYPEYSAFLRVLRDNGLMQFNFMGLT